MEQSLNDLLSDAFSEASVPFPAGDLDFEDLDFEEKLDQDMSHEALATKEDETLHQEATDQTPETEVIYSSESVDGEQSDEEDFHGVEVETPERDYTSSEEEDCSSGEDEEDTGTGEKPGDLLMSVHCGEEFCDGNKEDRMLAEGQPLAPEAAEHPQLRNEEQGESESDEEVSYFERVPARGSEMMIKGDEEEEREEEEDSSDSSECEGMKIEQEENFLEQELENPYGDAPTKASLEFPEISVQNLQDLIAEVESEELVEKIKDFSGEEHQEAGESFADYPSDFSPCEYVEDAGKSQERDHQASSQQDTSLERAVTEITWTGRAEDEEGGVEYLYSVDLEGDADKFRGLNVVTEDDKTETVVGDAALTGGESDSRSSSEDEVQVKGSEEESIQTFEDKKPWEDFESSVFSRWSTAADADSADFNINWNLDVLTSDTLLSEDLLTTEGSDRVETMLLDLTQRPAEEEEEEEEEEENTYTSVQTGDAKATSPSHQGSLDDGFFFNTELEVSGISELGQLGDDEYEEERNWEQEQERIKAFYEFYDDSDGETGREGRQIKVQFCADPLSQVIHYETDSSDRDSLSSSTDGDEDLSSAETSEELREPEDTTLMKPACDPPNIQRPETVPDLSRTRSRTKKHKCLDVLKLTLKMCVVILMGLLMFWLATDQAGWLSQASFF